MLFASHEIRLVSTCFAPFRYSELTVKKTACKEKLKQVKTLRGRDLLLFKATKQRYS